MDKTNGMITAIKEHLLPADHRKIIEKNALAKDYFTFLCAHADPLPESIFLCTKDGLVLACRYSDEKDEFSGFTLDSGRLTEDGRLHIRSNHLGYLLIAPSDIEPAAAACLNRISADLAALIDISDSDESSSRHVLRCLDAVSNAISVYDENAVLLFANASFCRDLSIAEPGAAIGANIQSIMKKNRIKIHSMEDSSNHLKMMDVLKKGETAIDWEVRIESTDSPSDYKLLSNDMYPVIDDTGQIKGMVELTHSRQQDIKRTRRIMGFTAEYTFDDIVGTSKAIRESIRTAKEYAASDFSCLITGESGVGKELFAQSIHNYSPRRKGPFVALNCANFSDGLIESELFGYVGGAFTGASKNGQIGKFELADGGTLFLDEIGELPLHFQSKLLRVLETYTVTRIGSSKPIPVNVRLLTATNRDLAEMVEEGLFRKDLYYRLQVLTIAIPPLRERRNDIPLLAEAFLDQAAAPYMDAPKIWDAQAKKSLIAYDWPGNVRELRNVINRATVLSKSRIISREILESSISSKGYFLKNTEPEDPEYRLNKRLEEIDEAYVNLLNEALQISGGNKKKAAELIGVSRKTYYRMLEKYGL